MDRDLFERFMNDIKKIYKRKYIKGNMYTISHSSNFYLPWLEKNIRYTPREKRTMQDFIRHATDKDEALVIQFRNSFYFLYDNFELMERAFRRAYARMYS